jgi:hypothetical protein
MIVWPNWRSSGKEEACVEGDGGKISLKSVGTEMPLVALQLDEKREQPNRAFAPPCFSSTGSFFISHEFLLLAGVPSRQQQALMPQSAFGVCTLRLLPNIPATMGTPQNPKRNERIKEAESIFEIKWFSP